MNALILVFTAVICGGVLWFKPVHGPGALLICALVSLPALFVLVRAGEERLFLLRLFVLALAVRIVLATIINLGGMEAFFGGDATTYDLFGKSL
jgi:hypothetical protein